MEVRTAIGQRVNERFMRLRTALESLDDESAERVRIGPTWNARDLAAHLAYWTDAAAEALRDPGRGGLTDSVRRRAINDEVYRRNRRMSFVMLMPRLRTSQERFMDALRALPDAALIGDTAARAVVEEGVIAHYDHHYAALNAAISGGS